MSQAAEIADHEYYCPCGSAKPVKTGGLYLAGMYAMARGTCPGCGRELLSHLHSGWNGRNPLSVEARSHQLVERVKHEWYHDWLAQALEAPDRSDYAVEIIRHRRIKRPVLVNCIDKLYGHCLHRLFAIDEFRRHEPKADLILLIPRFLAWMAPKGMAEIWIVDVPLRGGGGWLVGLAEKLEPLLAPLRKLRYLDMWNYPSVDVSAFTGVARFDAGGPGDAGVNLRPVLTMIWRDDRPWGGDDSGKTSAAALERQLHLYTTVCQSLRAVMPTLDVAVVGLGTQGRFPSWIEDQRVAKPDSAIEQAWCRRYARSHVVFGVHGSSMILPAAHANAALILTPADMYWHAAVTWEFINARCRANDALQYFHYIALSTSMEDVLTILRGLITRSAQLAAYRHMNAAKTTLEYRQRQMENPWVWQVPTKVSTLDPTGD